MDEYKIGEFGQATFIAKKNWKAPTVCYGRITDMDSRCIEFTDNDSNVYIIPKNRFAFEKKIFKDLTNN